MGFLRERRRRRIVRAHLIRDDHWQTALRRHPILGTLSTHKQNRVRELASVFRREVQFAAARGHELTDEAIVRVSALAVLPIVGLDLDWYARWRTVIVVPDVFERDEADVDEAGVVHEWREESAGEAWEGGPVTLSWKDVVASGRGDGFNVVVHEAAHVLDATDGELNGRPALHPEIGPAAWHEICSQSYDRLAARKPRRRSRIDPYALTDDAEFFAITSELFFERPLVLRAELPQLYGLYVEFYRWDPAQR